MTICIHFFCQCPLGLNIKLNFKVTPFVRNVSMQKFHIINMCMDCICCLLVRTQSRFQGSFSSFFIVQERPWGQG